MKVDLYETLKSIDEKHNLLDSKENLLNIGCDGGGGLRFASEVIKEGIIIGMELDESYKENLLSISEEIENVKILYENPLKESTWEKAKFRVSTIFNSLDLKPIKSLQAVERSLKVLAPGGKVVSVYPQADKETVKSLVSGLPLENTKIYRINGEIISISEKGKEKIY